MNTCEVKALVDARAALMWHDMTTNERTMVRFGMFPAVKMRSAEAVLLEQGVEHDVPRLLAVALMDCAQRDGGMRA